MFYPFIQEGELGEIVFPKVGNHKHDYILDPQPLEGPIKSLLSFGSSVCLSVCLFVCQFSIFLRNGSLVFF